MFEVAGIKAPKYDQVVLICIQYEVVLGTSTTAENADRVRVSTRYNRFSWGEVTLVRDRTGTRSY